MSATNFVENNVVLLKDGRSGTVVYVYEEPRNSVAIVEQDPEQCGHDGELFDVEINAVEKVLWSPN